MAVDPIQADAPAQASPLRELPLTRQAHPGVQAFRPEGSSGNLPLSPFSMPA